MLRYLGLIALPLLLLAVPVSAATPEQKMETCKFGAESQKLTGAKSTAFIKRCMANGNYEPAARRAKAKTAKKPAATPAAQPAAPAAPAAPAKP